MIQQVYGIKKFQTHLPSIAKKIREVGGHYLVTNRNQPSLVAIPFEDYKAIEDILLELNSPALKRELRQGRAEYHRGKARLFKEIIKDNE